MRKLRLDLEAISVESFAPDARHGTKPGTVDGHAKATYACTAGWDGCPAETVDQWTCVYAMCLETYAGWSCDFSTCINFPPCRD